MQQKRVTYSIFRIDQVIASAENDEIFQTIDILNPFDFVAKHAQDFQAL